jgi:hypothetical protein
MIFVSSLYSIIAAAPGKGPQGVDFLDNESFCFSTRGANANMPPVAIGVPSDNKIELDCDASIQDKIITFSGPEGDQLVKLTTVTVGDASELSVNIDDNKQTASATINWTPRAAGNINLSITATDNGLRGSGQSIKSTKIDLDLIYPGPCGPPTPPTQKEVPCEDARKFMVDICAICASSCPKTSN